MVALLGDQGAACGIGYVLDSGDVSGSSAFGFSVSPACCALANLPFVHELGHNLGMRHDRFLANRQPAGSFNYGYSNPDDGLATIMAYHNQCTSLAGSCARFPGDSLPGAALRNVCELGIPVSEVIAAWNRSQYCIGAIG